MASSTHLRGMLAGALLMAAGLACAAEKQEFEGPVYYRYRNAEGVTVINSQIPPEFVRNGYQVVNAQGVVLKEVPRALSEAERAQQSEVQRQAREQAEQRRRDEALLLRYSTLEDLAAARKRTLSEFDVRISILQGNILAGKQQVERELARAADLQRSGRQASPEMLKAIDALRREIAENEANIAQQQQEKLRATESYDRDAGRLQLLLERIHQRANPAMVSP